MADELIEALNQNIAELHHTMNRAVVLANSDENLERKDRKLDALGRFSEMLQIAEDELKAVKEAHG
jgi:hypothetical protein